MSPRLSTHTSGCQKETPFSGDVICALIYVFPSDSSATRIIDFIFQKQERKWCEYSNYPRYVQ